MILRVELEKVLGLREKSTKKIEIRDCEERHLKITEFTPKFPLQTRKSFKFH